MEKELRREIIRWGGKQFKRTLATRCDFSREGPLADPHASLRHVSAQYWDPPQSKDDDEKGMIQTFPFRAIRSAITSPLSTDRPAEPIARAERKKRNENKAPPASQESDRIIDF